MAAIVAQVAASSDDGYEAESTGAMNITGVVVQHISYTDSSARYWGAYRWVVSIPKGAIINTAYISPNIYSLSYDDANFNLHFEKAANPVTLTTDTGNITSRARTSASTSWVADSLGTGWKNSPSLVTPLQELVNAYDVTALVLIARPNTDALKRLYNFSYDQGSTYGAKLYVTYNIIAATPYLVELHYSNGNLISILENAHNIDYTQLINSPHTLSFIIPADDTKISDIKPSKEIWLRDYETGVVVRKFILQRKVDERK